MGICSKVNDDLLRFLADLASEEDICPAHVAEAIQYRMMDRYC
jgi:predicted ATPase with chaperone activity